MQGLREALPVITQRFSPEGLHIRPDPPAQSTKHKDCVPEGMPALARRTKNGKKGKLLEQGMLMGMFLGEVRSGEVTGSLVHQLFRAMVR